MHAECGLQLATLEQRRSTLCLCLQLLVIYLFAYFSLSGLDLDHLILLLSTFAVVDLSIRGAMLIVNRWLSCVILAIRIADSSQHANPLAQAAHRPTLIAWTGNNSQVRRETTTIIEAG